GGVERRAQVAVGFRSHARASDGAKLRGWARLSRRRARRAVHRCAGAEPRRLTALRGQPPWLTLLSPRPASREALSHRRARLLGRDRRNSERDLDARGRTPRLRRNLSRAQRRPRHLTERRYRGGVLTNLALGRPKQPTP